MAAANVFHASSTRMLDSKYAVGWGESVSFFFFFLKKAKDDYMKTNCVVLLVHR